MKLVESSEFLTADGKLTEKGVRSELRNGNPPIYGVNGLIRRSVLGRDEIFALKREIKSPKIKIRDDRPSNYENYEKPRQEPQKTEEISPKSLGPDRWVLGAILILLGGALAVVVVIVNLSYLRSYGTTTESSNVFAAVGVIIDVAGMALFYVSAMFGKDGRPISAALTLIFAVFCTVLSLWSSIGYMTTNISDTVTGAEENRKQHKIVEGQLADLQAQLGRITDTRTPEEIDQDIIRKRGEVPRANWDASKQCAVPRESLWACQPYLDAIAARAAAVTRLELPGKIEAKRRDLLALAPISDRNAAAETMARVFGHFTAQQYAWAWAIFLSFLLNCSGVLFFISRMVWR